MFNLHSDDIAYIFNLPKRRKDQFFIRVTYIDEIGNIVDSFLLFHLIFVHVSTISSKAELKLSVSVSFCFYS